MNPDYMIGFIFTSYDKRILHQLIWWLRCVDRLTWENRFGHLDPNGRANWKKKFNAPHTELWVAIDTSEFNWSWTL